MGTAFHRVDALDELGGHIVARARRSDAYVGVIPRRHRRGGRRDLVPEAAVVWADCDDARAVDRLRRFEPAPSMVVASGTAGNRHAYWFLDRAMPLDVVEATNRGLARALHSDPVVFDAARILRPAGSANWKGDAPQSVRLLALESSAVTDHHALIRNVPDLASPRDRAEPTRRRAPAECDPLLNVAPREYIERLTGTSVGADHKARCPFHDDQTPSLHVYDDPERGWYCFGCRRGGSIYDFAGLLWDCGVRGREFVDLRRDLERVLFSEPRLEQPTSQQRERRGERPARIEL